jgi:hypothetical protein
LPCSDQRPCRCPLLPVLAKGSREAQPGGYQHAIGTAGGCRPQEGCLNRCTSSCSVKADVPTALNTPPAALAASRQVDGVTHSLACANTPLALLAAGALLPTELPQARMVRRPCSPAAPECHFTGMPVLKRCREQAFQDMPRPLAFFDSHVCQAGALACRVTSPPWSLYVTARCCRWRESR